MSNQNFPRLGSIIIGIIIALGIPSAVGIAFEDKAVHHPWLTLILILLYEAFVVLARLVAQVGQKRSQRWSEYLAERIDLQAQRLFSQYYRRYLQHLIYQHQHLDVRRFKTQGSYTPRLEQVFVELSFSNRPTHLLSNNPFGAEADPLRQGKDSIWSYLASKSSDSQYLAIIGPPGIGKTTLLKHIALTLIAHGKSTRRFFQPVKLPVLLFLREQVDAIQANPTLNLGQAACDHLARWGLILPLSWIESWLEKGRCLVMLDGLDEVSDPQARQQVVDWVQRQMVAYGRNHFIVTSRPFGYRSNSLSGVTILEICPFTAEQIEKFIYNWYIATELKDLQEADSQVRMRAQRKAANLLKHLHETPALSDMAVNPLLLTMIATVHRYRGSLPHRRVELYAEICEVFLGRRQQEQTVFAELTAFQKQQILEALAYDLMRRKQREIPLPDAIRAIARPLKQVSPQTSGETFLQMVENNSGLVLEQEYGTYGFAHHTFQEYLAATHMRHKNLEQEVIAQIDVSWWHETICLYCAQANASPIIAACLKEDRPAIPALKLAIACREDAREVHPSVESRLEEIVVWGLEDIESQRQSISAEAMLARRLRQMVPFGGNIYQDSTLVSCAEYQLFLDDSPDRKPDHWSINRFPPGGGQTPVLGVRSSDAVAFCEWLTRRDPSGWSYRLPKAGEILVAWTGQEPSKKVQGHIGYWVAAAGEYECEGIPIAHPLIPTNLLEQRVRLELGIIPFIEDHLIVNRLISRALTRRGIFDLSVVRNISFAQSLARDLSLDLALSFVQNRANSSVLYHLLTQDLRLALDNGRPHIIDFDRFRIIANSRMPSPQTDLSNMSTFVRWYIRLCTLIIADRLLHESWNENQPRLSPSPRMRSKAKDFKPQQEIENLIDLYIDFAVLEERVQGTLPTFEGILFLKERT